MLEIAHGAARAVIAPNGAGLKSYEVNGVPYVETYDDQPPMGSGAVLVPWPNRTAGGKWTLDGEELQLEIGEPARGNAIHGLVRHAIWGVVEHTGSLLSLETPVAGLGWPVELRTTISYALDENGLTGSQPPNAVSSRTPSSSRATRKSYSVSPTGTGGPLGIMVPGSTGSTVVAA
ncbi:hypothetical protein K7G98_11735, partial [Saccharothrix sp. MB29]|nr:hypothetical protein [Saccharothrix sp. MB29]